MTQTQRGAPGMAVAAVLLVAWFAAGCASMLPTPVPEEATRPDTKLVLAAGDEIEVTFFGAANINTVQTIRRDGKIALQLLGEVAAAGMTLGELKAELALRAESQLQVKDLIVTLKKPSPVFVGGAVKTPGPVPLTHPTTVLDAVMQAGGFDLEVAEVRNVVVIRYVGSQCRCWRLDFEKVLAGQAGADERPFYLKPFDIVHVPAHYLLR